MSDMLLAALRYAVRWSVFPLHWPTFPGCSCRNPECGNNTGKHPLTLAGFKDASRDPLTIVTWWLRWPLANIGVPTGDNGLAVLDIDPRAGGTESLGRLEGEHGVLPGTISQCTGSGGCHLVYEHPGHRVKSVAGALGPGLDIKADGGYIVVAPSLHMSGDRYEWIGNDFSSPPTPWPAVLSRLLDPPVRTVAKPLFSPPISMGEGYGRAALEGELDRVLNALEHTRNDTLNRATFSLGQLVGAGVLDEEPVVRLLERAALQVGLTTTETAATIRSGLRSGMAQPRGARHVNGG